LTTDCDMVWSPRGIRPARGQNRSAQGIALGTKVRPENAMIIQFIALKGRNKFCMGMFQAHYVSPLQGLAFPKTLAAQGGAALALG